MLALLDHKEVTCLVLHDLSVAFDMVSHSLLLNRLKYKFGIIGSALNWIKDYLEDHCSPLLLETWIQIVQNLMKNTETRHSTGQCLRSNLIQIIHLIHWRHLQEIQHQFP